MNAPVAKVDEVAAITVALDKLLTACTDELRRPRTGERTFKVWSMADLMAANEREMAMTEAERYVHRLLDDPVGQSLRKSIRQIGKRLHELGGRDLMGDVLDQVADLDPSNWGRRTDICDKRWDGIGSWAA